MPKFNVHLYPVCRLDFREIEAANHEDALKIAHDRFFDELPQSQKITAEFAEYFDGALVDCANGDPDYTQTKNYFTDQFYAVIRAKMAEARKAKQNDGAGNAALSG
jgi:hypothetical protein